MVRSFWFAAFVSCVAGSSSMLLFGQTAPAGKKYAVLVGINGYNHDRLPNLKYAERDVEELKKVLEPAGYKVTLLTGSNVDPKLRATKAAIEQRIKDVLNGCEKGDIVLLGFAGHGLQFENQADAYFCPLDARPFADKTDSLVSLSGIYRNLEQSFAGMKVLLVDACRNDPDRQRGAREGIDADHAPRPPSGVAALFSCRGGERAFESDTLQHGVFFHHVLEALRGEAKNADNQVTFAGLAGHVSVRVARDVPVLIGGGARQSPNLKADYSTEPVLMSIVSIPRQGNPVNAKPPLLSAPDGTPVEIDGLKSTAPAVWKKEEAKGMGRKFQFRIAKAEGDPEDAELVIFTFGKNGGGGKDANITRWKGQFKDAPADKTKTDNFKVGNVEVTCVDIQGTYLLRDMRDPNAKATEKPNFRAVNVFFESPNGPYFIKLIGPAKTVEGQKAAFDGWLKAFK